MRESLSVCAHVPQQRRCRRPGHCLGIFNDWGADQFQRDTQMRTKLTTDSYDGGRTMPKRLRRQIRACRHLSLRNGYGMRGPGLGAITLMGCLMACWLQSIGKDFEFTQTPGRPARRAAKLQTNSHHEYPNDPSRRGSLPRPLGFLRLAVCKRHCKGAGERTPAGGERERQTLVTLRHAFTQ